MASVFSSAGAKPEALAELNRAVRPTQTGQSYLEPGPFFTCRITISVRPRETYQRALAMDESIGDRACRVGKFLALTVTKWKRRTGVQAGMEIDSSCTTRQLLQAQSKQAEETFKACRTR